MFALAFTSFEFIFVCQCGLRLYTFTQIRQKSGVLRPGAQLKGFAFPMAHPAVDKTGRDWCASNALPIAMQLVFQPSDRVGHDRVVYAARKYEDFTLSFLSLCDDIFHVVQRERLSASLNWAFGGSVRALLIGAGHDPVETILAPTRVAITSRQTGKM